MIIDKHTELCSAQVLTATAASTDYWDQGVAQDRGYSEQLFLHVHVPTTLDSAAEAATLTIELQCDSDSGFGSPKKLLLTDAIAEASLVQGFERFIPIPPGLDERYVRAYFTVGTENFTGGTISARIVKGARGVKQYPNAI